MLTPARAYGLALAVLAAGLACLIVALGLPWLTLAVVGGVIATRSWGRTLVGGLLVAAGLIGAVVPLLTGGGSALSLVGGLLVAGVGAWTLARGRQWPTLGSRYDSASSRRRSPRPLSAWDAQDRGLDPTAED